MNRKCIECGKMHDTVLEDTSDGSVWDEFDSCYQCLMKSSFKLENLPSIRLEAGEILDKITHKLLKNLLEDKLKELCIKENS